MLVDLARPADNEALLRLLRDNPMRGEIIVGLERAPDYFAACRMGADESHTLVIRDSVNEEIACVCDLSIRYVFVNGNSLRAAYLSNWRVDRGWRGRPELLETGLEYIAKLQRETLKADIFYSAIVADNAPARRRLERRAPGFAAFHPVDELITFIIRTRPKSRRAVADAVPASDRNEIEGFLSEKLMRFQFASDWCAGFLGPNATLDAKNFCVLRRDGRIAASGAVWDQRAAKQVVVHGYTRRLGAIRPFYNAIAAPTGRPSLPVPGSALAIASVAGFAADDADSSVALLDALSRSGIRETGVELLALTLSRRHPVVPAIRKRFRPWTYRSILYHVQMPSTLSAEQLNSRGMAQPEAALL